MYVICMQCRSYCEIRVDCEKWIMLHEKHTVVLHSDLDWFNKREVSLVLRDTG
jgi:hypothetical protein